MWPVLSVLSRLHFCTRTTLGVIAITEIDIYDASGFRDPSLFGCYCLIACICADDTISSPKMKVNHYSALHVGDVAGFLGGD